MNIEYMAKNLGVELGKQMKKFSLIQVIALFVVLLFIVYDTPLPSEIEAMIQEPFGKFILLIVLRFAPRGLIPEEKL